MENIQKKTANFRKFAHPLYLLSLSQPYGIVFKPFTAIEITTLVDLALSNHAERARSLGSLPVGEPRKMMDNTSEAIIILDKRGRVILLNTFASWFVDISVKEALMRHWRDVLVFINDQTGEELKDPVTEVTRQMAGATYDSNTAIVTTTLKRRKALVSLRPIRDGHDRFLAVLVSLRENVKKVYM